MFFLRTAAVLGVIMALCAASASTKVQLLVAYCPTDFTGEGAIVTVDATSGNWTIDTRFKFPSEIFGCVADYSPTFSLDPSNPNTLWFDFTSDAGYFLAVDTRHGNTTAVNSASVFFTGFLDFAAFDASKTLRGITGTVTESGYCSDGCLGFGIQDVSGPPRFEAKAIMPFKETADDARFVDYKTNRFYFQAAYDLNATGCAPTPDEHCLLTVDATSGVILSAMHPRHRYQAFKYGRSATSGSVLIFAEGFPDFCNQTGAATVFARLALDTAVATPHACIPASVVIDTDQWVSCFSEDENILVTASGNGEGAPPQFLSFDTRTGAVLANTQLTGLATALHADMKLIFVWGVEVVFPSPAPAR